MKNKLTIKIARLLLDMNYKYYIAQFWRHENTATKLQQRLRKYIYRL